MYFYIRVLNKQVKFSSVSHDLISLTHSTPISNGVSWFSLNGDVFVYKEKLTFVFRFWKAFCITINLPLIFSVNEEYSSGGYAIKFLRKFSAYYWNSMTSVCVTYLEKKRLLPLGLQVRNSGEKKAEKACFKLCGMFWKRAHILDRCYTEMRARPPYRPRW